MTKPSLLKQDIWGNHEKRVLAIFRLALEMLQKNQELPQSEDELNRKLCFFVRHANQQLTISNQGIEWPCMYEANNQPDADHSIRAKREYKRPDFQWGICDTNETNPERMDKFYILEAKRLGSPSSSRWILNENYILKGINRFILVEWGYRKSVSSGAMIGYIQNMELNEILNEVNEHCSQLTIIELTLSPEGWQNDVSRLDHQLERPDVPPSPFNLRHLWVDLRS
ncbi:MAG: hypothetical protein GPJ20_06460 [Microcystis aeruginosa BS13-10]|uniref:Restriction endonuclease n=1 Tax=Microcystis aeruginosa G11-04 TaxID=2685956 RepID=A0A966FYZ7_MICAE|nr:hypothetical protein [Microcystis aeruginosa LE13-04]NCS38627.1 hypothetical protein [Microcystis aeruginosa BS13-10]NCS57103.1 hypothetical protein [Microcystis aeruginosa G11-04]NCT43771.1 hypothetical protein [Microcystis aeruginosa G11-09]